MSGENIIKQSAALRGQGKFDEAIEIIEENIAVIDDDIMINALLEAFRAAEEKGDLELTRKYALLIAQVDPDVPSVQIYL